MTIELCLFRGQDPTIFSNQIDGNIWAAAAVQEYASIQLKLGNHTSTLVMKQVVTTLNFYMFQPKYNGISGNVDISKKISQRAQRGNNPNSAYIGSSLLLLSFMLYKREDISILCISMYVFLYFFNS